MRAGFYFTVKIQNSAKRQLLTIFLMEKRFVAKIRLQKNFEDFLIDSISSSQVASSRSTIAPTLSLRLRLNLGFKLSIKTSDI